MTRASQGKSLQLSRSAPGSAVALGVGDCCPGFTYTNTVLTVATSSKGLPTAAATPPLLSLTDRWSDNLSDFLGYSSFDDYFELDKFFEKTPLLTADVDGGNFCSVYLSRLGNFDAFPNALSFDTLRVVFWGGLPEEEDFSAEVAEELLRDCVTSELEERLGVPVEALDVESTAVSYGGLQLFVQLEGTLTLRRRQ